MWRRQHSRTPLRGAYICTASLENRSAGSLMLDVHIPRDTMVPPLGFHPRGAKANVRQKVYVRGPSGAPDSPKPATTQTSLRSRMDK